MMLRSELTTLVLRGESPWREHLRATATLDILSALRLANKLRQLRTIVRAR